MSTTMDKIRNGVDTEVMFGTLDAIKAQPELGTFQFRARNRWLGGAHNRSTIRDFHGAGQEDTGAPGQDSDVAEIVDSLRRDLDGVLSPETDRYTIGRSGTFPRPASVYPSFA